MSPNVCRNTVSYRLLRPWKPWSKRTCVCPVCELSPYTECLYWLVCRVPYATFFIGTNTPINIDVRKWYLIYFQIFMNFGYRSLKSSNWLYCKLSRKGYVPPNPTRSSFLDTSSSPWFFAILPDYLLAGTFLIRKGSTALSILDLIASRRAIDSGDNDWGSLRIWSKHVTFPVLSGTVWGRPVLYDQPTMGCSSVPSMKMAMPESYPSILGKPPCKVWSNNWEATNCRLDVKKVLSSTFNVLIVAVSNY